MPPIRVLLAEDDPNLRALVAALVEEEPTLELVAVAEDAEGAIAQAGDARPDVAVVDVNMPGGGGAHATRGILDASGRTRVIALTGADDRETVVELIAAGAAGYLVKGLPLRELTAAIHRAAAGESVLSPAAAASLVGEVATRVERERHADREHRRRRERIRTLLADGFAIALQPIRDLAAGTDVGHEALARFPGANGGGAAAWFAEADAVGLRQELELRAVGLAVRRLSELPEHAYLAVNVSPDVLDTQGFAAAVAGAPLERLLLEVTEHARVNDYDALAAAIAPIRAAGARLAVDDAGAGFASLRHILRLAPEVIKLDVSLTRGIDGDRTRRALASALIAFAGETTATIVAEGIETQAELDALRGLGVRFGQGFYLAEPALR